MPNRIIRDSSRTSPNLYACSDGGERLFWRLVTVADDFGRFDASPAVVLANCFPLGVKDIPLRQIATRLQELQQNKLVAIYEVNGRKYGYFLNWLKHQRVRASASKHPAPEDGTLLSDGGHPRTIAVNCGQARSNVAVSESEVVNEIGNESRKNDNPLFEFFFEEFPERNGKKVGKEQARAKFDKLPPEDQEAVLIALQNFKASQMVQDGIGIPDPHRFIRREQPKGEPWRDWLTPEQPTGPAVKCTWQVKHGHQLRPCGELVEAELSAKGEKTCQAHQEAKKQRQQRVAEMRGDEVTV